jgi:hypothetical protein
MSEKPSRKNRHGKTDTKEDLSIKEDLSVKKDLLSSSNGSTGRPENLSTPLPDKSLEKYDDDDDQYKTFRHLFVSKGGDDIKNHFLLYKLFQKLVEDHGFVQVTKMVETYIEKYVKTGKHDTPQVAWFLLDGWKSCTINNNTRDKREQKRKTSPIPAALAEQLQAQKEAAATVTEENDDDWNEINQQMAAWDKMKKNRPHTSV